MGNLSPESLAEVFKRLEAVDLHAPDDLSPEALAMFESIASNNRSRPWNQSHALALADYCRVAAMWGDEMRAIAREGSMVAGKPNPRFKVAQLLSADRLRLGKLLGIHLGARDRYTEGASGAEERKRQAAADLAASAAGPNGDLLA